MMGFAPHNSKTINMFCMYFCTKTQVRKITIAQAETMVGKVWEVS